MNCWTEAIALKIMTQNIDNQKQKKKEKTRHALGFYSNICHYIYINTMFDGTRSCTLDSNLIGSSK